MATADIFSDNEIPQGRRHSTLLSNNFTSDFSSSTSSKLHFPAPSMTQDGKPTNSSSSSIDILIVGAGIAGPLISIFLTQSELPLRITVLERAPDRRTTAQQIDIRGAGLKILKKYLPRLLQEIECATTKEAGVNLVDSKGNVRASFPVQKESEGAMMTSLTSEIEILRGDFAQILIDASQRGEYQGKQSRVEYVYGDHVTRITPPAKSASAKVSVALASGTQKDYDVVIGADGMRSSVRKLGFKESGRLKSLGQYTSYFTIPYKKSDGTFATWYNAPLGRSILLRPDNAGATRAYLSIMASDQNRKVLEEYYKLSAVEQKRMLRTLFNGSGNNIERVLKGMDDSDDFYMQEIAQVKVPSWTASDGHLMLLGDAGYCPSPISGMGTTLAVVGAYTLAGELVTSIRAQISKSQVPTKVDFEEAARRYERKMRPIVEKAQAIIPGAPGIANPMTWWGIEILLRVAGLASWLSRSPISKLFTWVGGLFVSKSEESDWDDKLDRYTFVRD
jgi:2-polyprenyl-6-methoxyphenol hydroxylase-like FAD-dependent oxidoreductase